MNDKKTEYYAIIISKTNKSDNSNKKVLNNISDANILKFSLNNKTLNSENTKQQKEAWFSLFKNIGYIVLIVVIVTFVVESESLHSISFGTLIRPIFSIIVVLGLLFSLFGFVSYLIEIIRLQYGKSKWIISKKLVVVMDELLRHFEEEHNKSYGLLWENIQDEVNLRNEKASNVKTEHKEKQKLKKQTVKIINSIDNFEKFKDEKIKKIIITKSYFETRNFPTIKNFNFFYSSKGTIRKKEYLPQITFPNDEK